MQTEKELKVDDAIEAYLGSRKKYGEEIPMKKKYKIYGKCIKRGKINNLDISQDYDSDPKDPYPVLLFTPNMEDTIHHYHVDLTKQQAKNLHKWLGEYLKRLKE